MIRITERDTSATRRGLMDYHTAMLKLIRLGILNAGDRVVKTMRQYFYGNRFPPELPSYKRTGTLARDWTVLPYGETGYMIRNTVPYASKVVGNNYGIGQAFMHSPSDRWGTLKVRDQVNQEVEKIPKEVTDALVDAARQIGFKVKAG